MNEEHADRLAKALRLRAASALGEVRNQDPAPGDLQPPDERVANMSHLYEAGIYNAIAAQLDAGVLSLDDLSKVCASGVGAVDVLSSAELEQLKPADLAVR